VADQLLRRHAKYHLLDDGQVVRTW
jgi:hypothetical protein